MYNKLQLSYNLLNGDCNFAALNNECNAKGARGNNYFQEQAEKSGGSGIRPWGSSQSNLCYNASKLTTLQDFWQLQVTRST